jgi:hypothetical protein
MFYINSSGKLYPESEADEIERKWAKSTFQQFVEYTNIWEEIMALGDEDDTPLPPRPMKVFPDATGACVLGLDCHHRVYRTHDTSTSKCQFVICSFLAINLCCRDTYVFS